jgi:predicted methyltransferase
MRLCSLLGIALVLSLPAAATVADAREAPRGAATSHRRFDDVEHWVRVFDDPARAAWQKPAEVVAALGLEPGMVVADVGAGTGYFMRLLATAVGPRGTVFAAEVEPALVVHLRDRAQREGTTNVVPVLIPQDRPGLPPGLLDLVLLVDTYHHIDHRLIWLERLHDVLRPGGRVAIVDWEKRPAPVGPDLEHKLAREDVVDEMAASGFTLIAAPDLLPYQYLLIFRRR